MGRELRRLVGGVGDAAGGIGVAQQVHLEGCVDQLMRQAGARSATAGEHDRIEAGQRGAPIGEDVADDVEGQLDEPKPKRKLSLKSKAF